MTEHLHRWSALEELNDDTLIEVFSFLPVRDILALRQTSKRFEAISRQRIIWHHVCVTQVLFSGLPLPIPHSRIPSLSSAELERTVRRSLRIGNFWLSKNTRPIHVAAFRASEATTVTDVRFLPGRGGRYVVTVTKGIWSVITCWEVGSAGNAEANTANTALHKERKVAEWCPKGAIFNGFVVNSDSSSEGVLAISVNTGRQEIIILGVDLQSTEDREQPKSQPNFRKIGTINTTYRPVNLDGSLVAFSNESTETIVMDWKTGAAGLLCSADDDQGFRYNRCLQVLFVHSSCSVVVVRARTLELFPMPHLSTPASHDSSQAQSASGNIYHPVARHSFGLLDGVALAPQVEPPLEFNSNDTAYPGASEGKILPLSILVRKESDDPWTADMHRVEMHVLYPDPTYVYPSTSACSVTLGPYASSFAEPQLESELETEKGRLKKDTAEYPPTTSRPPPFPTESESAVNTRCPYIFPPIPTPYSTPTPRGLLRNRCTDIFLGPCGSALWVQPHTSLLRTIPYPTVGSSVTVSTSPSAGWDPDVGLTAWDVHASRTQGPSTQLTSVEEGRERGGERLVGRLFGGRMRDSSWNAEVRDFTSGLDEEDGEGDVRVIWMSEREGPLSAVDYEEGAGRVVVGEGGGWVTVLDLAV